MGERSKRVTDSYEEVTATLDETHIPGYQLVSALGGGAFGQVYLARRAGPHGFEKLLVLKRLHPHIADDAQAVAMFHDEARLAARIHDPRVVEIQELGEADGVPHMVMEYLAGESIAGILGHTFSNPSTWMPFPLAVRVIAEAAGGLHVAHELKDKHGQLLHVIHRDVTPSNIFVLYSGGVKLLDFGVARARSNLSIEREGELIGKVGYHAPEQLQGIEIDRRADVFSLGVVLWELLVCRRLYFGDHADEVRKAVLETEPPPPSSLNPKVPAALDAIVLRALALDRDQRFQTAEEMQNALDDFLATVGAPSSALNVSKYMKATFPTRVQLNDRILELGESRAKTEPQLQLMDAVRQLRATDADFSLLRPYAALAKKLRRPIVRAAAAAAIAAALIASLVVWKLTRHPATAAQRVVVVSPPAKEPTPPPAVDPSIAAFEKIESAIRTGRFTVPAGENAFEMLTKQEQITPNDPRIAKMRALAIESLLASAQVLWEHDRKDSARSLYQEVLLFDPAQDLAIQRTTTAVAATAKHPPRRVAAASGAAQVSDEELAWLIAQIELAIIERRFVAPADRNALDLLLKLRTLDPNNETTARLGSAVASALRQEARKSSATDAATLEAAAQKAQAPAANASGTPKTEPSTEAAKKAAEDATREGKSLLASGDFAGAKRAFDRAVAANSRWHPALGGLADAAFNSGDYSLAVLSAKRAIDAAPRVVAYRMTLAKAYYKLSRYKDALDAYNAVLAIEPGNTTAQHNAEMVRGKLGS